MEYKLEGYDKDGDCYITIAESDDINSLKQIGISLWKNFRLARKSNDEPIDWIIITSEQDKAICFLSDETDCRWSYYKYATPQ